MKQNYIFKKIVLAFLMVFGITITTNTAYGQVKKELNIYQTPVSGDGKQMLRRQIIWADFSNATNYDVVSGKKALKVGTKIVMTPTPGYTITATVTEFKPFHATKEYEARILALYPEANDVQARENWKTKGQKFWSLKNEFYAIFRLRGNQITNAGFNDASERDARVDAIKAEMSTLIDEVPRWALAYWSYKPNDTNVDDGGDGTSGRMVLEPQSGRYSNLARSGFPVPGDVTIATNNNAGNVGVYFKLEAKYFGKKVKPTLVVADGEECVGNGGREWTSFITNGTPWEMLANIGQGPNFMPAVAEVDRFNISGNKGTDKNETNPIKIFPELYFTENDFIENERYKALSEAEQKQIFKDIVFHNYRPLLDGINAGESKLPYITAKSTTEPHLGLGTQVFGGFSNRIPAEQLQSTPLVISKQTSEVAIFINAGGKQASMFGFVVMDEGDAPDSYGGANHLMRIIPGDPYTKQPYVGDTTADMDLGMPGTDFFRDDIYGGDEGEAQLLGVDAVTGKSKTGITNYPIHIASKENYELPVLANRGGDQDAYYKAWADFNGDGVFTENEASQVAHLRSGDGKITFRFKNKRQLTKVDLQQLAVRIRASVLEDQIQTPTGYSFSGEVEDFAIHVVHAPRGSHKKTTDVQGVVQKAKFTANDGFNAYGKLRANVAGVGTNKMDISATKPVKIVKPDGTLVSEYTEAGVGHYAVDALGNITFTPEKTWDGTTKARGIVLRATDQNDITTGWTFNEDTYTDNGEKAPLENINDGTKWGYLINGKKTMDAVYVPNVIPVTPVGIPKTTTDVQGKKQNAKVGFTAGSKKVPMNTATLAFATNDDGTLKDQPAGATLSADGKTLTVPGEGTYTIEDDGTISFQPEANFKGEAKPVKLTMEDANGTKAEATYTPTVTPVTPTAEPKETQDIQGKEQTGKPKFTAGDKNVPMNDAVPATFEDGNTTKTIAGEGTYTVSADGTVTFTPEKGFTGEGTGVVVVREDKNGTTAKAKYTPTVTPVTPKAVNKETSGKQGEKQKGAPTFIAGNEDVPMDDSVPAKLIDKDGNKVDSITVDGEGTYTVAPDGTVTFVPEPTFTGKAKGVEVVRVDENGTEAKAKYIPTVTPVTPTGEHETTRGAQGVEQSAKVDFTEGDESVPMNDNVPAKLIDPVTKQETDTVTIAGEGTYTVSADGTVTFTPEKDFGKDTETKGTKLTVVRVDANGTKAEGTYQATVTPVQPTAKDATSVDIQGQKQTGTPKFKKGDDGVPMDKSTLAFSEDGQPAGATVNGNTLTVPGEGVYTLNDDGTVDFQPEPTFTGEAKPVKLTMKDTNGTAVEATYTPTVTPVKPEGTPKATSGKQGEEQRKQ